MPCLWGQGVIDGGRGYKETDGARNKFPNSLTPEEPELFKVEWAMVRWRDPYHGRCGGARQLQRGWRGGEVGGLIAHLTPKNIEF